MSISDTDGKTLVKTARLVVTEYLKTGRKVPVAEDVKSRFSYNSGVFVTLNSEENLRGCIGFPTPDRKLYQSLVDAAIASATSDPRFPPVKYEELSEISKDDKGRKRWPYCKMGIWFGAFTSPSSYRVWME